MRDPPFLCWESKVNHAVIIEKSHGLRAEPKAKLRALPIVAKSADRAFLGRQTCLEIVIE